MPRKPLVIPDYEFRLCIPQDLFARLTLDLWSEAENRVPHGEYKRFFEARLREWFNRDRLDLATIVPGLQPGIHFAYGERETLNLLRRLSDANLSRE